MGTFLQLACWCLPVAQLGSMADGTGKDEQCMRMPSVASGAVGKETSAAVHVNNSQIMQPTKRKVNVNSSGKYYSTI